MISLEIRNSEIVTDDFLIDRISEQFGCSEVDFTFIIQVRVKEGRLRGFPSVPMNPWEV